MAFPIEVLDNADGGRLAINPRVMPVRLCQSPKSADGGSVRVKLKLW